MDYKKEIIEIVEKMESIRFLAMIYSFAHTLFEKEKSREVNPLLFYLMNFSMNFQNNSLSSVDN